MIRAANGAGAEKVSSALQQNSSAQKMRPLFGSMSSTETKYLLPSRRRWPEATYCAFTRAAAAAGDWLRNEKAVPRAMMLMLRSLATPKIMSLVTLSASVTSSGVAAVNGITRIVGLRVRTTSWPDGASGRAMSAKVILAGLETDRCAAARSDLSDVGLMPSL